MVSVLWWLLLLHVFTTAMEIVLTLASNLENISNKKKKHFLALVCLFFVNVNNWLRIISLVNVNLQLSYIVNDQEKISPNHINTISSRQVMRIKKNFN